MKILSISIAAYNVEKFLKHTLESLNCESVLEELEVIIVNDGSKDGTEDIAQQYVEKYPGTFKLIDKQNGGYGSTINESLKVATGKYYKLLDGDDWFDKRNLCKIVEILRREDSDIITFPYTQVMEETGEQINIFPFENMNEGEKFTFKNYPVGQRLCMHQVCFKTERIKNKGLKITEHCFYTDTEYLIKCMSKCDTIVYYNCPIYMYRVGRDEQSMSVEGVRKHYKDAIKCYKELIRYRKEINPKSDFYINYLEDALIALAMYNLNLFFLLSPDKKNEYVEYDKFLKENCKHIYQKCASKKVKILRKTNNMFYGVMCRWSSHSVHNKKIV